MDNKWGYFFLGAAIVALGAVIYQKRKDEMVSNSISGDMQKTCFNLSTNVDPAVFGPGYWNAFHTLAHNVPCSTCQDFAVKFMIFFHDLVNIKLNKPIQHLDNFNYMTDLIMKIKLNGNKFPS